MDMASFGPLVERLGSFALIVWLMIWDRTRMASKMDTLTQTLARTSEALAQGNAIQERSLKVIERVEARLGVVERAA